MVEEIFEEEADWAQRLTHSSLTKVNSSSKDVDGLVGTVTAVFRRLSAGRQSPKAQPVPR
jgi:hypothetical protein